MFKYQNAIFVVYFLDKYLTKIPVQQLKFETEALKTVKMLDNFAFRLNFLLQVTLRGRKDRNEGVARSVFQSIELIITSVQKISLGNVNKCCSKYNNAEITF